MRVGLDLRFETPGFDPFPVRDLGLTTYWMSRPLIEFTARQRVRLHPKIAIRERCRALEGFPRGFLPFGDAICRFNPVYGQV